MQSAKTFSPNLSITLAAASLTGLVRSAFRLFAFYSAKFRFDQEEVLGVLFKAISAAEQTTRFAVIVVTEMCLLCRRLKLFRIFLAVLLAKLTHCSRERVITVDLDVWLNAHGLPIATCDRIDAFCGH